MNMTAKCNATAARYSPEMLDWGIRFLVDSDRDAFEVGYAFRNSQHGYKIEECPNIGKFSVTVWNENAKRMGCDV